MAVFKTRARALDMLGRQQIAGIPTAISELFKNAHDAYADNVIVDYYRSDNLFILRDDGLGMTRDEFERRWLTLGTESKIGAAGGISLPAVDPDKPRREITGEKGIGRLAIASIGRQVLIMTRAKKNDELSPLVVCFIHWGLFECAGVDMDQIEIPISTFSGGTLPTAADIKNVVGVVAKNVNDLASFMTPETMESFHKDLDSFSVDPKQIEGYLGAPRLSGKGHGTHFFIMPADESLVADIDDSDDDTASPITKTLLGFANTMTPDHEAPRIAVSFRDHKTEDFNLDLLQYSSFFTPQEFENADHHFKGEFDEYGQFRGEISVFGEETKDYVVPWPEAHGVKLDCGRFSLDLAYIQGTASDSTLPREDHARIIQKLNQIGGLYIYRDGIRVLPYGDSDVDFLDIEKNRSKKADYYFFSYRRMFGLINLTKRENSNLSEKAGREGFRTNRAYRQFRAVLNNFFLQVAAEFFRKGGDRVDIYQGKREELERVEVARRKREKQSSTVRSALRKQLDAFFDKVDDGTPQLEAERLLAEVDQHLNIWTGTSKDASDLLAIESDARKKLDLLRSNYRTARPRGVGLTKQLQRDLQTQSGLLKRMEETVFLPAAQRLDEMVNEAARSNTIAIDVRRRLESAIGDHVSRTKRLLTNEGNDTQFAAEQMRRRVVDAARQYIAEVDNALREVVATLSRFDSSSLDEANLTEERVRFEADIDSIFERYMPVFQILRSQVNAVDVSRDDTGQTSVGIAEINESIEEELLALRERADEDAELTQLGMAIEVVNHEFYNNVRSFRYELGRLKVWADANQNLRTIYLNLSASFQHIDAYLALLTPLHRRLYGEAIVFSGEDIFNFVNDLFRDRFENEKIEINATKEFLEAEITGFPSVFYPVFVNLIDNAAFWLRDRSSAKSISLDHREDAFIVSDSGPGVSARDRDAIFERRFTRKPGGRGMGLFISREVLHRAGYELSLEEPIAGRGATFRIEREVEITDDEDDESVAQ